jgi:DNA primase
MDAVEDIKQRLSIEDVVGQYVELKRAGRNFKGLSPFTNERTASLMVSPEKQIWHDFSSAKGGSMFGFVMEMEGVDFKEALEILARKAGVDLEQYRGTRAGGRGKEKERLYELLDLAAKFYQAQLKNNHAALEYVLKKRGFAKETALEWRLGYSPDGGTALVDFLKSRGFSEHEIKDAGLSTQRYRGPSDMFRGRVMIPLADAGGRVIGFTARLLADDPNAPKYINTPQTLLYDKSRHVFGLHFAKEAMRKSKFAVLAEGNLDVISSHQAGVRQVAATAGTALTEAQLKAISRFTDDIRLCFDADQAGMNATERAIPIASKANVSLSVIMLPSGKDPDELIRQDAAKWQEIITKPQYALDWLIDRYAAQLDITTAQGKRQLSDIVLNVVRVLNDGVEQEHYVAELARRIGVSQEALTAKLRQKGAGQRSQLKKPAGPVKVSHKTLSDYLKAQDRLLALTLTQPPLRTVLERVTADMLVGEPPKTLHSFLQKRRNSEADKQDPLESPQLQPIIDYVKVLLFQYEQLYADVETVELKYEVDRLEARLIEQYVKMQKQRIVHRMQTADDAETNTLLEQAKKLDNLLKTHKRGA